MLLLFPNDKILNKTIQEELKNCFLNVRNWKSVRENEVMHNAMNVVPEIISKIGGGVKDIIWLSSENNWGILKHLP